MESSKRRSGGRVKAAAAAALMAAASLGVTGVVAANPEPAGAAATACARGGCDMFQYGPRNGYFFTAPGYTPVTMKCWTDSSWYAGTNRWFKVTSIYGTGTQWISANQVINQTRVGHC